MSLLWIFSLQILHIQKVIWWKEVPNLSFGEKGVHGKILNLIQYKAIFLLCIMFFHLPFAFPFHHWAPQSFLFWCLFSKRNRAGMEKSTAPGEAGRTMQRVSLKGCLGANAMLPNIRGEPSTGGWSVLHKVGPSPSLFFKSPQTSLLPRYFKKHHL